MKKQKMVIIIGIILVLLAVFFKSTVKSTKMDYLSHFKSRFIDNGDGTIKDTNTDLIWLKDANCFGDIRTYEEAVSTISKFNSKPESFTCTDYTANKTDWRLPSSDEFFELASSAMITIPDWLSLGFVNVQSTQYWASSGRAFDIFTGGPTFNTDAYALPLWPVRPEKSNH